MTVEEARERAHARLQYASQYRFAGILLTPEEAQALLGLEAPPRDPWTMDYDGLMRNSTTLETTMGSPGYNIKELSQTDATPDTPTDIAAEDGSTASIAESIKATQEKLADPEE